MVAYIIIYADQIYQPPDMCYNQRFLMITYPLKDIVREQWERKISCTSMYTIPAEDEAYPVLQELN